MNDVCYEFWDSVGCDFVVNVEKWYIQTSILLFNDMVRWIFCYKIFFKKVFSFLWRQLRNFMFPHYYHIREIQTWKQNLFVRFFCLGFFVWIHMYHQLLIFLSHFVTIGFYFRLRNPLIGNLSIVFLLLLFTKFFLRSYYVPSKKFASKCFCKRNFDPLLQFHFAFLSTEYSQ